MKNEVQTGNIYDFIAPTGGVTSGTPVLIGSLLVIPLTDADQTLRFAGSTEGVFDIDATSADTPAQGDVAYWDDTAKEVTTTVGTNTFCGWFMEAKINGVTTGRVKLAGAVS